MCGISAIFLKHPRKTHSEFSYSLDLIKHRGPDSRGIVWGQEGDKTIFGECFDGAFTWALGHVRLAILDTSMNGLQPMKSADGAIWISYNGEVYNYLEIKEELQRAGYCFRNGTDTEVILAAYSHWGISCIDRFIGMFAFVIVDLEKRTVFCARDRFGIKPLYFYQSTSGTHIFSEPKQLKAFPEYTYQVNRQLLVDLLVDGVVNHVPDETLFKGIIPLVPGYYLYWSLDDPFPDLTKTEAYWTLSDSITSYSMQEAIELVESVFLDAVRLRLRSDVPVGSCLSGGIDSSSIVGVASHDLDIQVKTFSACFDGYSFDEQYYMDAVTQHCGAMENKVYPKGENFALEIDNVIYHQDEPFINPSIYSQWCVMREARNKGVPVLLDGQGGDEALCGYRKYSFFYLNSLLQKGRYATALNNAFLILVNGDKRLLRFSEGQRYLPGVLRNNMRSIDSLLRPEAKLLQRKAWQLGNVQNRSLRDYQKQDILRWSLPALLRYEDRNSMAHSVESRVPFLDHRFIELCMSIPDDLFFLEGKTKRLLTNAMGKRLPKEVHNRRVKYGFSTPNEEWLQGDLGNIIEKEIFESVVLNDLIDKSFIQKDFISIRNGEKVRFKNKLFLIGCIAIWMRIFKVEW